MKKARNTIKVPQYDEETEELELPDAGRQDRTLILNREPPARKGQLMAYGVKEIRCISCIRIRPIAGAEEYGDGWICEDCLSEEAQERKYGGQRGR